MPRTIKMQFFNGQCGDLEIPIYLTWNQKWMWRHYPHPRIVSNKCKTLLLPRGTCTQSLLWHAVLKFDKLSHVHCTFFFAPTQFWWPRNEKQKETTHIAHELTGVLVARYSKYFVRVVLHNGLSPLEKNEPDSALSCSVCVNSTKAHHLIKNLRQVLEESCN